MNCYNGEEYLREAIDSIFAQTFKDWEIIFWDNNSSDSSADIVRSYNSSKVKYFKSEILTNLGEARKNAVKEAQGEWVAFLDCDDIWYPEKLDIQISALKGTDFVFTYAGILEVTADCNSIREVIPKYPSGRILGHLLNQFDVNMVTPVIRRSFLVENKINFEPQITASEEYNLFVRLAARGNVLVQKKVLGKYRVYSGSLTDRQISRWAIERRITLLQLVTEVPSILLEYPIAYREAEARGDYYEARYLMVQGNSKDAKKVMKKIAFFDLKYFLLMVTLYIPGLWVILHDNKLRRKLVQIFE